jgi:7,8-dihydropterin-6-yl-methyl-4-(beta-D-ribofuranosyl)aminobenzene 5'-phosphate synthase
LKKKMDRRTFIQGSAALAAVATAALCPAAARAQVPRITAPAVDKLSIRVVTDSVYDIFLKDEQHPGLKVERKGLPLRNATSLHGEWGLALYLEALNGQEQRNYLLDFGWTPDVLINNLEFLEIDPANFHGLILSHAHHDHFGGLSGFLKKYRDAMASDLPLYTGGEDAFCYRYWKIPNGFSMTAGFAGVVDRRELAAARIRTVLAADPIVIDNHAFTTGVVPLGGIERILPGTFEEYGAHDGAGCDASHFAPAELMGQIVPDQHWGEHATCFNVKDKGLVILTSCGHRGILNNIRYVQAITGIQKVHVLAGGFHLGPAPAPYLAQVVDELAKVDLDYLIPMHCSGANFVAEAAKRMPEKLILSSAGSRFTFGA